MTIRNRLTAGTLALALALPTSLGTVAPAAAGPGTLRAAPLSAAPAGEVIDVQARRGYGFRRGGRRGARRGPPPVVRQNRALRRELRRRDRRRDRRRNRRNLAAGIVGGLIVGGIIANSARRGPVYAAPAPVYRGYGPRHHDWCYARYRSYRASDGTFQPYHGPRKRCNSPYDGI